MILKLNAAEITALNNGDPRVFTKVYNSLRRAIYVICYRNVRNHQDAEDLTSDTFESFLKAKNKGNDTRHVKNILYTIARRRIVDFLEKHRPVDYQDLTSKIASLPDNSSLIRTELEFVMLLQQSVYEIEELPPQCRLIFKMYALDRKNRQTIAQELAISRKTVDEQIRIARQKIITHLREKGFDWVLLICLYSLFF